MSLAAFGAGLGQPGQPSQGTAGRVDSGPDSDGLISVLWDAPEDTDATADTGGERIRWLSRDGYTPVVDDEALMLTDSQGDAWAIVTPAVDAVTPMAVLREAPLNVRDPRYGGDLALAFEALPESGGRRSGHIVVPPGDELSLSSVLVLDDAGGVVIEGMGGTPGYPRLVWTGGAGSGPMIRVNSGYGVQLRNLLLGYTNAAYDGDLISTDHGAPMIDVQKLLIDGCWLGGLDGATGAASLVELNKIITSIIRNCNMQSATRAIKRGADYATTVTIEDTVFAGFTSAPIYNPDNCWRIRNNTFEPLADGSAGAVDHDMTFWTTGFLYDGNYHADATEDGTWVRLRSSGGLIGGGNFVVVPTNGIGYYLERTYGLTFTGLDVQKSPGATGTVGIDFNNEGGDKISETVTILGGQNTCDTTIRNSGFCFNLEQRGVYPIATNPPRGINEGYVGVASASTLVVPTHDQGGLWLVSGTTTITSIGGSWNGRLITLVFASTAQVTDGGNLSLEGNFTGGAGRTLTLRWDTNAWQEIARSTN